MCLVAFVESVILLPTLCFCSLCFVVICELIICHNFLLLEEIMMKKICVVLFCVVIPPLSTSARAGEYLLTELTAVTVVVAV